MNTKRGSAILVVLAVLTILVIISTFVIQSKTQRASFTRYMSNEKKVEALAEAVLDMTLAQIRIKANDENDPDIYPFLREAYPTANGKLSNGGKNSIMKPSKPSSGVKLGSEFYNTAFTSITTGDTGKFSAPEVSMQIVHAEAFGEKAGGYEVVGITIPPKTSSEKGAEKFPGTEASPNTDWRLPFHYPPYKDGTNNFENVWNEPGQPLTVEGNYAYKSPDITVKLDFKGLIAKIVSEIGGLDDEIDVNLLLKYANSDISSKTAIEFGIKIEDEFIDKVNDLIEKYNNPVNPLTWFAGKLDYITTESVNELIKEAMDGKNTIDIEALLFEKITSLEPLKNSLSPKSLQSFVMEETSSSYSGKTYSGSLSNTFIEKGGLLQLTCKVGYIPNGSQAELTKTFVGEIPFKVSDVQPIAPEYTFFIANSKKLGDSGASLPQPIDFNCSDVSHALAVNEAFILHNMHHKGTKSPAEDGKTKKYSQVTSLNPPAGKIRVNGSDIEPVFMFAGTLNDGIAASELTALALSEKSTDADRDLQLKATFGWFQTMKDEASVTKYVKIHFPVLRTNANGADGFTAAKEKSISGIYDMYKNDYFSDIFTKPTLFYGYGHLDYPLGNKIEGKVGAKISEMYGIVDVDDKIQIDIKIDIGDISVNPHHDPWDKEVQTYFGIKNIENYPNGDLIPYGLPNISTYNKIDSTWESDEYNTMPANCYSDVQYQKKATSYYTKPDDFLNDLKQKNYNIDGVNYIEGELNLSGNYTFSGNGLIIASSITIEGSTIDLTDSDSSLGLIARSGTLSITNSEVCASCFSYDAPVFADSIIYGNLVMNAFDRTLISNCHVRYTPSNISVKETKFYDNTDKLNIHRYYASFAENWSKSYYEKK